MSIEYVFIDNGGVITDNSQRGPIFQSLVGQIFRERFGGDAAAWGQANVGIVAPVWGRFLQRVENWDESRDIRHEKSLYYTDWMRTMFERAGRTAPFSDTDCAVIGREIEDLILLQAVRHFPGADEAIEALAARYSLFMASDGFEDSLVVALESHARRFRRLYGPDLVNVPKSSGRPYYEAIFADAGVDPAASLVIDDGVTNLMGALAAGARTLLISQQRPEGYDGPVASLLADVPGIIDTL